MTSIANRRFSSGLVAVLATMAIVLALSAPAFAQSTLNGYGGQAGKTQSQVQGALQNGGGGNAPASQSKTVSASKSSKSLPFTGLELGLMLAVGGSLIAVGVGLRRIVRLRPPVA
jgi:hypothetical protein